MKAVIYSTNKATWGGSEALWKQLCIEARNKEIDILASSFFHPEKEKHFNDLESKGIVVQKRTLPTYPESSTILGLWNEKKELNKSTDPNNSYWKEIIQFNPDELIFNLGEAFEKEFALLQEGMQKHIIGKIPYSIVVHFIRDEFEVLDKLYHSTFKELYRKASKVYFVSEANKRNTERQLGIPLLSYAILDGQLAEHTAEVMALTSNNHLNLAMVARLEHDVKGQDLALSYLYNYPKKDRVKINFYGEGPSLEHLQKLTKFYELETNINFHGFVQDKKEIWRNNDALLLMSRDEGLPLSLLEAMTYAKTFISTPAGGIADLDKNLGFQFDYTDFEGFYTILDAILKDKNQLSMMGIDCLKWVEQFDHKQYSSHFFQ